MSALSPDQWKRLLADTGNLADGAYDVLREAQRGPWFPDSISHRGLAAALLYVDNLYGQPYITWDDVGSLAGIYNSEGGRITHGDVVAARDLAERIADLLPPKYQTP